VMIDYCGKWGRVTLLVTCVYREFIRDEVRYMMNARLFHRGSRIVGQQLNVRRRGGRMVTRRSCASCLRMLLFSLLSLVYSLGQNMHC
jgi:hypothetical protein